MVFAMPVLKLLFASWATVAFALEADAECGEAQSCSNQKVSRAGAAFIQTAETRSEAQGAPLKGRVGTLEQEVASLKSRVGKLQTEVGWSHELGTATAVEAAAPEEEVVEEVPPPELLSKSAKALHTKDDEDILEEELPAPKHNKRTSSKRLPASLLESGGKDTAKEAKSGSLKGRVATVEADMANLRSRILGLENQVSGKAGDSDGESLLQEGAAGSSLKSRIVTLEEQCDAYRTRVSTLEHMVEG